MKKILKIISVVASCLILASDLQAQQSTNTSGGNAAGSGGTVSYSIGQLNYQTNSGINGSIAEGVQQPFEISELNAIEEAKGIDLLFSVYPNPTTNLLTLSIKDYDITNLSYELYDANMKLLKSNDITENPTSISMHNLASATYFVKVIQGNKEVKTFKVIKN